MGKASKRKQQKRFPTTKEPYASAIDKASEDDRVWFEVNPGATHRIRNYIAGEIKDYVPPTDHKILVRQIRPGVRVREAVPPEIIQLMETSVEIFNPIIQAVKEAVRYADKKMKYKTE